MSEKDTGGSAFPFVEYNTATQGMTLRDYAVLHGPWTIKNVMDFINDEDMSPYSLSQLVVRWNNCYADYFVEERNND